MEWYEAMPSRWRAEQELAQRMLEEVEAGIDDQGRVFLLGVFFGHIARDYGNDYEKYVRETNAMTDANWARDLGSQIVEVSHIALAKHKRVGQAAIWVFIALILWFVSFAFLFIMTP